MKFLAINKEYESERKEIILKAELVVSELEKEVSK
jgi:hypothetical protein